MIVATATPDGQPSARTVLLKDVDARGFVFYTNYDGRKGRELIAVLGATGKVQLVTGLLAAIGIALSA